MWNWGLRRLPTSRPCRLILFIAKVAETPGKPCLSRPASRGWILIRQCRRRNTIPGQSGSVYWTKSAKLLIVWGKQKFSSWQVACLASESGRKNPPICTRYPVFNASGSPFRFPCARPFPTRFLPAEAPAYESMPAQAPGRWCWPHGCPVFSESPCFSMNSEIYEIATTFISLSTKLTSKENLFCNDKFNWKLFILFN